MSSSRAAESPPLELERSKATFDVTEMRHFLYDNKEEFEKHAYISSLVEVDPIFSKRERLFLSRTEAYKQSLRKSLRFKQICEERKLGDYDRALLRMYIDEQLPVCLGRHERARAAPADPHRAPDLAALCHVYSYHHGAGDAGAASARPPAACPTIPRHCRPPPRVARPSGSRSRGRCASWARTRRRN